MEQQLSNVAAIKMYFSKDPRPVTIEEVKALTQEERQEVGDFCRAALNAEATTA